MNAAPQADLWLELPENLRRPALRGIRWTLWLSAAAVPFSFGTRILLARMGPHVLAVYGLLLVYINFVSAFFLLGGNAVVIRYLPAVPRPRQPAFLRSYAAVTAAWLALWMLPAWLAPGWLRLLFGSLATARLCREAVLLAPLVILFSLSLAALKSLMEIDRAQVLYRLVTIGSFGAYGLLFLLARQNFRRHPAAWIGGVYFSLVAIAGALALLRLRARLPRTTRRRWHLPSGFWRFTFSLESVSMLGFFAAELDMLFVLHSGGLRRLGGYVAVMTLGLALVPLLKLLLESLMASLTNALALGDLRAGGALVAAYARLLLPAILLFGAGLAAWAPLWLSILGAAYTGLSLALVLAACGAMIYGLNCLAGSLLSAMGFPQSELIAKLASIGAFVAAFFPLWRRDGLLGAVAAWCLAQAVYLALNGWALLRRAPFPLAWLPRSVSAFFVALTLAAGLAAALPPGDWLLRVAGWLLPAAAYAALARYSPAELRQLAGLLLPGKFSLE